MQRDKVITGTVGRIWSNYADGGRVSRRPRHSSSSRTKGGMPIGWSPVFDHSDHPPRVLPLSGDEHEGSISFVRWLGHLPDTHRGETASLNWPTWSDKSRADAAACRNVRAWPAVDRTMGLWRALEPDWDGDEGAVPSSAHFAAADRFVARCMAAGVMQPRPYIAGDGEFGFHWDGERQASLSFLPEGRFVGYCDRRDGTRLRIAGPLDIAAASTELFGALADL